LTDSAGVVTDTYDFDAFGNLVQQTGNTPNNYLFAGEQWDPDLGLYYNRARYLNVGTGRFWSMDSYEGGSYDPSSLHKYLYVNSDPVNNSDPSGRSKLAELLVTAYIVLTLVINAVSFGLNSYRTYTAKTTEEKIYYSGLATLDLLGLVLSLGGGGFIGPGTKLLSTGASSGGFVVSAVSKFSTAARIDMIGGSTLIGSLSILAAANDPNSNSGGDSGSGGGSSSSDQLPGSGPVPGTIEVSPRAKSFGVLNQIGNSKKTYIYVFDPESKRMLVAPDYTNPGGGFRHSDLVDILGAQGNRSKICAGRIIGGKGKFTTDEGTGTYNNNWSPESRNKIKEFLNGLGFDHTHSPTY
jgi:RHS repeat-associated protein